MTERTLARDGSDGTNGTDGTDSTDGLALLREEVARLVRDLPGELSAVTARIGEVQLEITWADQTTSAPVEHRFPAPTITQAPPEPVAVPGHAVVAPLVGTFYRSPEPGARPFVAVGDQVVVGQPIGIVEAMKLMNQVDADRAGIVVEVLVDDATAVEFGQPLVRIEPAAG